MCTHMFMVCVCTRLTTHKLLTCNQCVSQRLIIFVPHLCMWVYFQCPSLGTGRSRSPRPRLGYVEGCDAGRNWCTHLASQFPNKNKKSTNVTQTDAALAAAASAAGGDYIAKTGHCGFACKKIAKDLTRLVLKTVQVPQPYIVTIPAKQQQDWLDEV